MGTRVAPSFNANTYMGKFEREFVHTYRLQPFMYLRYLDDVFLIWRHSLQELNLFVDYLNSRTDSIRVTMEFSRELISFLETTVKLRDRTQYTDLYCKSTDSHSYLLYNSAHPWPCKKSIPYSQLLRIRKICSSLTDFDKHALDFASYFQNRGYPSHLIEEAYIKARRMDRNHLLDKDRSSKDARSKDNTILVSTYITRMTRRYPRVSPQIGISWAKARTRHSYTKNRWWMFSQANKLTRYFGTSFNLQEAYQKQ